MTKVISISVNELVQAVIGYQAAVDDLHDRLKGTSWDDKFRVTMAFERWTHRHEEEFSSSWRKAYETARDYIEMHGLPPWDGD